MKKDVNNYLRKLRKIRVRKKIFGDECRPRMSVFISNKNVYVQIIDDSIRKTLLSGSTLTQEFKSLKNSTSINSKNIELMSILGNLLAEKLKDLYIDKLVLDRGTRTFHGKIKQLVDTIRSHGVNI